MLFLSDLPSVVSGLSALFADDTFAYDRCDGSPSDKSSSCCHLQHDLTSIYQWSNEWATTFNPAKSAVVDFRGKRKKQGDCSASPSFGTMSVPVCEKVKHLGIQLTSTLLWTPHVDSLLHRVTHKVFILRRLAYRCRDNKIASRCGAPRPPMTDVGTETAFRLNQRKHFRKSKHLLRSEVS